MGIRVGIDLGTTFSAVARIDPKTGSPVIIRNGYDEATTPSVLSFEHDGRILYGQEAKERQEDGYVNVAAFFKRNMGLSAFFQNQFGKQYSATDYSGILLRFLKEEAEAQCGEHIDGAVITVPAYFTHRERTATMEAGKQAGLNVLAIINEPTAAAFAYGLNARQGKQTVLVYDLGGGTFDVTIAHIDKDRIDILGSDGDHALGGKDWDDCIAQYLLEEFEDRTGVDISDNPEAINAILVKAENTKKKLTSKKSVMVPMHYGGMRDSIEVTQDIFEGLSKKYMGITEMVTERLMSAINVTWKKLDGVILVGGSTRMKMVRDYVKRMSGREPMMGVNPDEAVALGAAIYANMLEEEIDQPKPLLSLPSAKKSAEDTSAPFLTIRGAKTIRDVTSHALGTIAISTDGNSYINNVIIKKNTPIPANETSGEMELRGQDEMEVYVLQGDSQRPLDNEILHKYVIHGIKRVAKGWPIIRVTYRYDSNGVVQVSAMQKGGAKELPIRIEPVPSDMSWTDESPKMHVASEGTADLAVLLTVDVSGSMDGKPLEEAKKAMYGFVDTMKEKGALIGFMPFADRVKRACDLTDDYTSLKEAIEDLSIGQCGYSNSAHPFTEGYEVLMRNPRKEKYIIVLADGVWSFQQEAIQEAKRCHKSGINVIALGFGHADRNFLQAIASTKDFATMTDLSKLQIEFSKIARVIGNSTNR